MEGTQQCALSGPIEQIMGVGLLLRLVPAHKKSTQRVGISLWMPLRVVRFWWAEMRLTFATACWVGGAACQRGMFCATSSCRRDEQTR